MEVDKNAYISNASNGIGRYALGLIWLKTIRGIDPYEVGTIELDEEVSEEQLEIAKKVVSKL